MIGDLIGEVEPPLSAATAPPRAAPIIGAGLLLSALFSGTAAATPLPPAPTRYFGDMTSTARTSLQRPDDTTLSSFEHLRRDVDEPRTSPSPVPVPIPGVSAESGAGAPASGPEAVRWLHDASGLTWDQLGKLFGVSRRAVHLWATGSRMNAAHAETLATVTAAVQNLHLADADQRRAALFAQGPDGQSLVDRLLAQQSGRAGDITAAAFTVDELPGARHGDVSA